MKKRTEILMSPETRNELKQSNMIQDFINEFRAKPTKSAYRTPLLYFFYVIGKDPDTYIKDVRKMGNGNKIDALDQYEKDIKQYWNWLLDNKYTPKSISNYINVIKIFFRQHRIQFDDMLWDNIRKRGTGSKPTTKDKAPTNKQLKRMLNNGNSKSKALFLTLSSSGMRIGEALTLTDDDIDMEATPTTITIGADKSKNKVGRTCFISDEATDVLKQWIEDRPAYIELSKKRYEGLKDYKKKNGYGVEPKKVLETNRLFPFTYANALHMWNCLLKNAKLDEKDKTTGIYVYHLHTLRKYFKSRFRKYDPDIAEKLMGHEGYMNGVYDKWTDDELAEAYQNGVKHLLIFETPADTKVYDDKIQDIQESLLEKDKTIETLNSEVEQLKAVVRQQATVQYPDYSILEKRIKELERRD